MLCPYNIEIIEMIEIIGIIEIIGNIGVRFK